MTARQYAKNHPTKHDYHHAVTGQYLFSRNDLSLAACAALEAERIPVRVYRNSTPSFELRKDKRFVRYQTPFNGVADNVGYYKYA